MAIIVEHGNVKDLSGPAAPTPRLPRIALRTPKSARFTLARLIRYFHDHGGDIQKFRTMVYGLSELLRYFAFEKDSEIEARLDVIEKKIEDLQREKTTTAN